MRRLNLRLTALGFSSATVADGGQTALGLLFCELPVARGEFQWATLNTTAFLLHCGDARRPLTLSSGLPTDTSATGAEALRRADGVCVRSLVPLCSCCQSDRRYRSGF